MENLNLSGIMACSDFEKIIKDFYTYFGVALNNLTCTYDSRIPVAQINNENEGVQGLRNIVSQVSKTSDPENEVVQDQWVEYTLTRIGDLDSSVAPQMLKELSEYMVDKVYFVGNQLGPIDILLYYLLYSIMMCLTFQEKEKYLHISRWFNNMQQNRSARSWRSVIPFSRSCMYV